MHLAPIRAPKTARHALLGTFVAVATLPWSTASALQTIFDISAGPRVDELHWSISGGPGGPNILSELTWRSVDSVQLGFDFVAITDGGLVLDTELRYGQIYDGNVQDSDYAGNNRTLEFSRSLSQTEDDDVLDITLSLGYSLPVTDAERTRVTPLIGFSFHEQDFRITDGVQQIDRIGGTAGQPINALESSYRAEWWSTFLGVQIDHRGSRWDTWGRVEYHNIDYEASANWNLRDDLAHPVSFKHKSDGSGPVYEVGARFRYSENWAFNASFTWSNWDSDSGTDRTYLADGRVITTELNTAQWEQNALLLGVSYVSDPN